MSMRTNVEARSCPSCGAPLPAGETTCRYCGTTCYITTFRSAYDLPDELLATTARSFSDALESAPKDAEAYFSIGCCYLRLGQHAKAQRCFGKAIDLDLDNPEAYLYRAVARVAADGPSDLSTFQAEEAARDIRSGLEIENIPGLYMLWAIIQSEAYEKKGLRAEPSSQQLLEKSAEVGGTQDDLNLLIGLVR